MKKKIKLRDITVKQYQTWIKNNCDLEYCDKCPFRRIYCVSTNDLSWIKNKDLYSDKFLDQEVEIEEPELLTKEEKEYLEAVIRPFKDEIEYIAKYYIDEENKEYIYIYIKNDFPMYFPCFKPNKYYKGLERTKRYTLEELGLFEEKKYKITLTEFWISKDKLAIHCKTEEQANKLLKAFDKLGKKWRSDESYLKYNFYETLKEKICYSNCNTVDSVSCFKKDNFIIYEFEEVDLEN